MFMRKKITLFGVPLMVLNHKKIESNKQKKNYEQLDDDSLLSIIYMDFAF